MDPREHQEVKRLADGPVKRKADCLQSTYPSYQNPKRAFVPVTNLPSWTSPSGIRELQARQKRAVPKRRQSTGWRSFSTDSTPSAGLVNTGKAFLEPFPRFSPELSPDRLAEALGLPTSSTPTTSPSFRQPASGFSLFVYLAIESSSSGSRPVKEICSFILNEFGFSCEDTQNLVRDCLCEDDTCVKVASESITSGEAFRFGCQLQWALSSNRRAAVQMEIFEYLKQGADLRHYQGFQKYYGLLDESGWTKPKEIIHPVECYSVRSFIICNNVNTENQLQEGLHCTEMPGGDQEFEVFELGADSFLTLSGSNISISTEGLYFSGDETVDETDCDAEVAEICSGAEESKKDVSIEDDEVICILS